MRRPLSVFSLFSASSVLMLSVMAAACGGSETDSTVSDPPPTAATDAEIPATAAGDSAAPAPVPPNGEVVEVQSLDNSFRPQDITIEAGTEVVFVNVGRNDHNVLPEPDSIQGWGVAESEFAPGDEYRHVFDVPGVYAYVCTIHGVNGKGMVGTVTVTG